MNRSVSSSSLRSKAGLSGSGFPRPCGLGISRRASVAKASASVGFGAALDGREGDSSSTWSYPSPRAGPRGAMKGRKSHRGDRFGTGRPSAPRPPGKQPP